MGPIDRDFLYRCQLRKQRKFQFSIEIEILVIWRPLKITSEGPWPLPGPYATTPLIVPQVAMYKMGDVSVGHAP